MFDDFPHSFYYSSLIIGAIISIFFLLKGIIAPFNLLSLLIVITLFSESIAKLLSYGFRQNNSIVYHFFVPIEYLFYVLIYTRFFGTTPWKKALFISFIVLVVLEVINTLFFQSLKRSNTNTLILEAIFLVVISLFYFKGIRNNLFFASLLKEGAFWFNASVLLYYSLNILIWGFHSLKVYQMKRPPIIIYDFNLIISGGLYLIYSLSLILAYVSFQNRGKYES